MAAEIPVRVIIDAIDNASRQIKSVGDSLNGFASSARTAGAAGAALGGVTLLVAKTFIEQAGAMEQNQVAFETMLGSASRAKSLLQDIADFAKITPFNIADLVEGSKKLLAYNVSAEELIPTLSMLGDIASGVGADKLPNLILAFGQVQAATRLTGMELRQFSEAGVPLLKTLADQAGTSAGEMTKSISAGEVSFDQVKKALMSLTDEGGKFHDLMQKQSLTTIGKVSNLQDAFTRLEISMGKVLLPTANQVLDKMIILTDKFAAWAVENPKLEKAVIGVGLAVGALGVGLLALGMALPPIIAGAKLLFTVFGAITTLFGIAQGAVAGVVAILGGPLTLIIAALISAIFLLTMAWTKNWGDIHGKVAEAGVIIQGVIESIKNAMGSMATWIQDQLAAAGAAWQNFISFLQTAGAVIGMAIGVGVQFAIDQFNAFLAFLQALPGLLVGVFQANTDAIFKFFIQDLPFAIGFAVGAMAKFFTETIPAAFQAVVVALTEFITVWLPMVGAAIMNFFLVSIPATITAWIVWLQSAIPAAANFIITTNLNMINQVIGFFVNLKNSAITQFTQMKDAVIAAATSMKDEAIKKAQELWSSVVSWFHKTVSDVTTGINQLPGNVSAAMENVRSQAVSKAEAIYNGVKGWFDKIIGFFNDIIGKANDAFNAAQRAFTSGFSQGKRQFGGPVSAAASYVVGERGPEIFTPQVAGNITPNNESRGGGGPGVTIQFIINSDMIINSPNERRSIAEALYKDLVTLARSQNLSVAELMGA